MLVFHRLDRGAELTFSIGSWVIPHLLARVNVYPPFLVFTVYLGPDVVLTVPDPSYSCAGSPTQHAEAIGELSCASSSSFEQCPHVGVSGEPFIAGTACTSVQFDPGCTSCNFVGSGRRLACSDAGAITSRTSRVVDKGEEGTFEPARNGMLE